MRKPIPKPKKKKVKLKPLDDVFSQVIRERDGKCMHCGKKENLQCSHVLPRTYISIRWDLENAITLCYRCHIHWWHKYPHDAVKWFDSVWPGRYAKLKEIAEQHNKVNKEEIYNQLKITLKEMEGL